MFGYQVFVLGAILACTLALPPPSYIKPCHSKDANFKKCLVEQANAALPVLAKGDNKYKVPAFNPLKLPLIHLKQANLDLQFHDVSVYGLDTGKITGIDFTEDKLVVDLFVPKLEIIGPYTIEGNIILLKLKGSGPSNITAVNGNYKFTTDLKTVDKNGEAYIDLDKSDMTYKIERAYFRLDNLLNENVGIDVNQLLNDSWEDVLNDLGAGIKDAVDVVYKLIISNIFQKVPKKDIFPE